MKKLLKGLTSYDEDIRKKAAAALVELGDGAFDAVAAMLEHPVARWEAVSLITVLSPARSVGYLVRIVNSNRELSVREREHEKKYFRIRAIESLGDLGQRRPEGILAVFAQEKVEEALGYFIDPAHPHLHEEVIAAVVKALERIDTPAARQALARWQN